MKARKAKPFAVGSVQDTTQPLSSPKYTLNLTGQEANANLLDKNVCGGLTDGAGQKYFKYDLSIVANELDEQGFVLDNIFVENVRDWFNNSKPMVASCETLAGGLIDRVYSEIGFRLESVTARVYNLTGNAEVSWDKSQHLPTIPYFASKKEINAQNGIEEEDRPSRRC